jgi:cell filamentation protein
MKKLFKQSVEAKYYKELGSEDFAKQAAHFLAELNAIHSFREGS